MEAIRQSDEATDPALVPDPAEAPQIAGERWRMMRPLAEQRLDVLRLATQRLAGGRLEDDLHAEAARHAHSLAEGLEMFGLEEASRLAGVLEGLLAASPLQPEDAIRFRRLIAQVEATLGPAYDGASI
jgi:HPt (histidine-containing phosphotransfer) domain-containing protein